MRDILSQGATDCYLARQLDIELDPDFIFDAYRTPSDFDGPDAELGLLEARGTYIVFTSCRTSTSTACV